MTGLTRRAVLAGGMAVPLRVWAAPYAMAEQHRRVLAAARDRLDRAPRPPAARDRVAIADFSLPSSLPRFHFADLEAGRVQSFLVAHGRGSDPQHDGFLKTFSNVPDSEATSRGSYLTAAWYEGRHGLSIRLEGIDADNSNAMVRAIVIHPAGYATPDTLARQGRLGRSDGCFAMNPADFPAALWQLGQGRLLYADRLDLG